MKQVVFGLLLATAVFFCWSCDEDTFVEPKQVGSIRGQVLLSADRQPVTNALVRLSPSGRITESDSTGTFRFDSVLAGKYTVQVTREGYRSEALTVEADQVLVSILTVLLTNDRAQNRPPTAPAQPVPAVGSPSVSVRPTLHWTATDPTRDSLTYDVFLYREGTTTPTQSFTGLRQDTLVLNQLAYNTSYYWQVLVKDGVNTVNGPLWSFRTQPQPDYPYVFTRRVEGRYQIFMASADQDAVQLTSNGSNWRPVVSPNRQQIAFVSNVETDLHLYVMNYDGSNLHRVTTVPIAGLTATDLSFGWSPDGTQLVYPSHNLLYAVRTDGTGLRRLAQVPADQSFAGCDWSGPADRIIARLTNGSVYRNTLVLISPETGALTNLISRPDGRMSNPVFSVDGQQILFSYDVSKFQDEQGRQLDARLFLLTLATGDLADLSSYRIINQSVTSKLPGTNDLEPRFSPNGAKIVFTNTDNTGNKERSVLTIELSGSTRTQLLSQAEMPYWR